MSKYQKEKYMTASMSLETGWDVTATIAMLQQEMTLTLAIGWTESHQD